MEILRCIFLVINNTVSLLSLNKLLSKHDKIFFNHFLNFAGIRVVDLLKFVFLVEFLSFPLTFKSKSRQRSGNGAIRKKFPFQKPRLEKNK